MYTGQDEYDCVPQWALHARGPFGGHYTHLLPFFFPWVFSVSFAVASLSWVANTQLDKWTKWAMNTQLGTCHPRNYVDTMISSSYSSLLSLFLLLFSKTQPKTSFG